MQNEIVMCFCCALFNLNTHTFAFTTKRHQAEFSYHTTLRKLENPLMFRKSSGNVVLHMSPAYLSPLGLQCSVFGVHFVM
jgi:hypothetical protein